VVRTKTWLRDYEMIGYIDSVCVFTNNVVYEEGPSTNVILKYINSTHTQPSQ
jgi:hypothetical protein